MSGTSRIRCAHRGETDHERRSGFRAAGGGIRLLQVEQLRAEIAERMGDQPGNVHLGDAEPLADLRLRHAAMKAHQQDLLLTRGQFTPVRGDGLHAEHVLQPRILLAEILSQDAVAGLPASRRYPQVANIISRRGPGQQAEVTTGEPTFAIGHQGNGNDLDAVPGNRPGRRLPQWTGVPPAPL